MAHPSFDVDRKYTILQNIGKGSAGSVFLCKSKRDQKSYALKQIFLDKRRKARSKEVVLREVQILQKLDHPHIVHYHESFFDRKQDNLFIVQDYCSRGSLHEQVKSNRQKGTHIPERQIMEWFVQITMALRFIHNKRVLHRDLKTQNVFLTRANIIKIGDFGIARVLEHTIDMASTCVGTPCYLSPEICQDKPYNSKSDIWALGCLLYELCVLKPAFNASNLVSLCYKIVRGSYDTIPEEYSNLVKMLVEKSLQKTPELRPSATAILNLAEVKEQLSQYITDKETERQSAHPAKRRSEGGAEGAKRASRGPIRPHVVNIGDANKGRKGKKPKKGSPASSGGTAVKKKKKKKVTKSEANDADEVKKLPDSVLQNRPAAGGSAIVGYSPPTIRREPPPPEHSITPSRVDSKLYQTAGGPSEEPGTPPSRALLCDAPLHAPLPSPEPVREPSPPPPPSASLAAALPFPIDSTTDTLEEQADRRDSVAGRTYSVPTTLFRRPGGGRPVTENSSPAIPVTSPHNTGSTLTRTPGQVVTPLPRVTMEEEEEEEVSPAVATDPGKVECDSTAQPDQDSLLPGQVGVGWTVTDGLTGAFIPASLEHQQQQLQPDQELGVTIIGGTAQFEINTLQDITLQPAPSAASEDIQVKEGDQDACSGSGVSEEMEFDYSDDFEELEEEEGAGFGEIPHFETVQDIPDLTAPGESKQEGEESEEEEEEDHQFEMAMKSAKVALDNIEEDEEESFVEEYVIPSSAGNVAALRQYCMDVLGPVLFRQVQCLCRDFEDNYDSHETFMKNLELLAGTEKLEICLIVDEFFVDE